MAQTFPEVKADWSKLIRIYSTSSKM